MSKLMDLSARKYDPQTGSFTSVNELWAKYLGQYSYHYAFHDPINCLLSTHPHLQ